MTGIVYVNDADTLFRLDIATQELGVVGQFQGCQGVNELAIDRFDNMFATTTGSLFAVDPADASCAWIGSGGEYPRALSFVPAGVLDPDKEVLVGYLDDAYLRIDETTGAITKIGELGGGFVASGDMVSLIGGKSYLTVTNASCNDCLAQIDPFTGGVIQVSRGLLFNKVWGLAYWGGVVYGFTSFGSAFRIDHIDDTPLMGILTVEVVKVPLGLAFWGAGSSTAAPLD